MRPKEKEELVAGLEHLERLIRAGWCKGAYFRSPKKPHGKCHRCLYGALSEAFPDQGPRSRLFVIAVRIVTAAIRELYPERQLPEGSTEIFNDHPLTRKKDVLAVAMRARELAVKEETSL